MIHRTLSLCLVAAALITSSVPAAAQAPQGLWVWDDGRAAVEFHPCQDALCGRIVWLKADAAPATPMLDAKNPVAALRQRPVCGIDYITGVKRAGPGKWKGGRVYDFNSGNSYDLDIDTIEPARVTMRGYKGLRLFGANLILVRPKSDLPRCPGATGN